MTERGTGSIDDRPIEQWQSDMGIWHMWGEGIRDESIRSAGAIDQRTTGVEAPDAREGGSQAGDLATAGERLYAKLIESATLIFFVWVFGMETSNFFLVMIIALNALLIAERGQSLGKIVAGIRIIRARAEPAGFVHGFLLREMVPSASMVLLMLLTAGQHSGVLVTLAVLLDLSLMAGENRQCGHDLIAGTLVIRVARS